MVSTFQRQRWSERAKGTRQRTPFRVFGSVVSTRSSWCPASSTPVCPRGSWERSSDAVGVSQVVCARCAWAQICGRFLPGLRLTFTRQCFHTLAQTPPRGIGILSPPVSLPTSSLFAGIGVLKEEGADSWCCQYLKNFDSKPRQQICFCITTMHVYGFVCVCVCIYIHVYIHIFISMPEDL